MTIRLQLETLRRARGLIEAGWTQGTGARDKDGKPCDLAKGASFCTIAALDRADMRHELGVFNELVSRLRAKLPSGNRGLDVWNDASDRVQWDVLALFDQVIRDLEGVRDGNS